MAENYNWNVGDQKRGKGLKKETEYAIIVGVIMTKILIAKSNELLHENLDHFKDTFDRALGHYVKSRTEAEEVKSHAKDAQKKLDDPLDTAHGRVDFIDTMSQWMLWAGLGLALMMFILVLRADYSSQVESAWVWGTEVSKMALSWLKAKITA